MKVKLNMMKCKSDDEHSVSKRKIDELTKQLQEKMDEMDLMESFNQIIVIKERKSNDELQDIRKVLISVCTFYVDKLFSIYSEKIQRSLSCVVPMIYICVNDISGSFFF